MACWNDADEAGCVACTRVSAAPSRETRIVYDSNSLALIDVGFDHVTSMKLATGSSRFVAVTAVGGSDSVAGDSLLLDGE